MIAHPKPIKDPAALIASIIRYADAHYARENWLVARDFLSLAVEIDPGYPRLLGSLGSIQFQLQEYPAACTSFSAAVRRNPDDPDLHIQLAMVHSKLDHPGAAEAALNRALGLRPDDPTTLRLLADSKRDQGRYQEAGAIYGKLINRHPDQVGVFLSLAKCFFKLGDREGTQAALELVLTLDPNNEIARENLATLQATGSGPCTVTLQTRPTMPTSNVEHGLVAAANVARDWVTSPYYSDAEKWTWIFWDPISSFKRLFDKLPAGKLVDLACGHGRHSEKLLNLGRTVIALDIVPENITATQERLRGRPNFAAHRCNGVDFQPVADKSMDAIICYDAMVHFDCDVVHSYLRDAVRILRPGGMGLFHHSNYDGSPAAIHYGQNPHARNFMTARLFAHFAHKEGCSIIEQQIIPWGDVPALDCISLFQV